MSVVLITGSSGLVGSESVNFFCNKGFDVIGIDNNLRQFFFGKDGSTNWLKNQLIKKHKNFKNFNIDIRNYDGSTNPGVLFQMQFQKFISGTQTRLFDYTFPH